MASQAAQDLNTREYLALVWAKNALPYQLIEDPLFDHAFSTNIPKGFTRHELSKTMLQLSDKITRKIEEKLGRSVVTMAVDGMKNVVQQKMVNICVICKGEAYYIDSCEVYENSGDLLFDALMKGKKQLEDMGLLVVAIVGDNHAGLSSNCVKKI